MSDTTSVKAKLWGGADADYARLVVQEIEGLLGDFENDGLFESEGGEAWLELLRERVVGMREAVGGANG